MRFVFHHTMKAALLFVVGITGVIWLPLAADTIKTKTGELKNIVIQEETYKVVRYYYLGDRNKTLQKVDASQIVSVTRETKNLNYQMGEELFQQKQYSEALPAFKRAWEAIDWSEQHALFRMAQCYYYLGNLKESITHFQRLLKKFPESFYLPQVHYQMAQCSIKQGKWKAASESLQKATAIYEEIKKEAEWFEATYLKGIVEEKQNRHGEAVAIYKSMQSKAERHVGWKSRATLRIALCGLQKGDDDKSRDMILALLDKAPAEDKDLLAGIYTGLGHYCLKKQDVKTALLHYLRVVTLYADEEEFAPVAFGKAAYCFELLKDKNQLYAARARQLKEMQRQKFGQSKDR